jgi:hypothetical protein
MAGWANASLQHDPNHLNEVISAASNKITKAVDCTGQPDASPIAEKIIAPSGGKMVILNPPNFAKPPSRKDIEYPFVKFFGVFGVEYEIFGVHMKPVEGSKELLKEWMAGKAQEFLDQGGLRSMKVKKVEGGLKAVGENLGLNAEGKVSGEKVVYEVGGEA